MTTVFKGISAGFTWSEGRVPGSVLYRKAPSILGLKRRKLENVTTYRQFWHTGCIPWNRT